MRSILLSCLVLTIVRYTYSVPSIEVVYTKATFTPFEPYASGSGLEIVTKDDKTYLSGQMIILTDLPDIRVIFQAYNLKDNVEDHKPMVKFNGTYSNMLKRDKIVLPQLLSCSTLPKAVPISAGEYDLNECHIAVDAIKAIIVGSSWNITYAFDTLDNNPIAKGSILVEISRFDTD